MAAWEAVVQWGGQNCAEGLKGAQEVGKAEWADSRDEHNRFKTEIHLRL